MPVNIFDKIGTIPYVVLCLGYATLGYERFPHCYILQKHGFNDYKFRQKSQTYHFQKVKNMTLIQIQDDWVVRLIEALMRQSIEWQSRFKALEELSGRHWRKNIEIWCWARYRSGQCFMGPNNHNS